jgi:hypothetical protein
MPQVPLQSLAQKELKISATLYYPIFSLFFMQNSGIKIGTGKYGG